MKKITKLAAILAVLLFATSAMGASISNTAGKALVIADTDRTLTVAVSPKVNIWYATEATTTNEQWYAISTYHAGGKTVYMSAQNFTKVGKWEGDTAIENAFAGYPETEGSETDWDTLGFKF